jgi:glycosyltransferase involved in cell wall biosynthesis
MDNKRVKICFISLNSYPLFEKKSKQYFGGAELQISLVAKQLAKDKQFQITVINRDYGQKRLIKKGNIYLYRCFDKKYHSLIELFKFFVTLLIINADVYVQRTANNLSGLMAIFCKLFDKQFVYMAAHDWDCQPKVFNKITNLNQHLFHFGLKEADLIVAQSKKQQQLFLKNFGKKSALMRSLAKVQLTNKRIKKDIILWVGRADYWKRPINFIQLAKTLPNEKLVMICRKGINNKLFENIKIKAEKQKNIQFLEAVPIEEISTYFNKAKLFVNTSVAEGFPNTFIQSGLARTPILSLLVNPDNYLNQFNCGLSCHNSSKRLIRTAKNLVKKINFLRVMGRNHYNYVKKYHTVVNIEVFKIAVKNMLNRTRDQKRLSYKYDKWFVNKQYFKTFNKNINWQNPQTYNEKLCVKKISKEIEDWWIYADKWEVRKFVKKTIGKQYLVKSFGVFNKVEEINFNKLPNQYILKATHGSGWTIICKNKSDFDQEKTITEIKKWLKINYYRKYKERQYKKIKPKIICEKYLEESNGQLSDYKIFCFDGQPKFIHFDINRFAKHRRNFYDLNWKKLPFYQSCSEIIKKVPKPKHLSIMIKLAKKLSAQFDHARIDFYEVNNRVYFSEITFTQYSGTHEFTPPKYDLILGKYFKLNL